MSSADFLHSALREKIVEHLFVGELLRNLWQKGIFDAEVLKSEFDAHGYDIAISSGSITRHIQLKTGQTAKPPAVSVAEALATKPSGCVIWIRIAPDLAMGPFFFLGGRPGKPLPRLDGFNHPKRTTPNSAGDRPVRKNHRSVPGSRFKELQSFDDVLLALFGEIIPRRTIKSAVEELVRNGEANSVIWNSIRREFHLSNDKRGYPAWYRWNMKRDKPGLKQKP